MNKTIWILATISLPAIFAGCSSSVVGLANMEGAAVQRADPITSTGREAAVLSLHRKTPLVNGCRFGLTLTNNLPFEIADLGLRFTARREGGVVLEGVTRSFFRISPTQQQFHEITFQIDCNLIDYIEVSDPGRCMMGGLTRQTAQPGQCLELVDIPQSPFVTLVKAR